MIPEWILKLLEGMGVPGGIIFVLLTTVVSLVVYIKSMQTRADKIYGYRLQERDTLNKTLSETAKVLEDMLEVADERNELTEEQSDLISKQAQALDLLKVTILSQYDNIRDHNTVASQVVTSMAEAIRTLTSMVVENRSIARDHVTSVQGSLSTLQTELVKAVRDCSETQIKEMRALLGSVTRIEHRRKSTPR
jgi:SMC interacting uncharacterized protein involved in chromosome segregation